MGPRVNAKRWAAVLVSLVLVAGVVGLMAETQVLAAALRGRLELGEPLGRVGGTRVTFYGPWAAFRWRAALGEREKRVVQFAGGVRWMVMAAVMVGGLAVAVRLRKRDGYEDAHGTAKWGTTAELKERGLLDDAGIVLCQTEEAKVEPLPRGGFRQHRAGRLVRDSSGLHVLVYAPSGSGKTVAICVPSLLSWTQSVVVWDTKRELYQATAGWRGTFSRVVRFEPTSPTSGRYNPLAEIRKGSDAEVRDTQAIAEMLADPEGKGDSSDNENARHFRLSAQKLLETLILHVVYTEKNPTLPRVAELLTQPVEEDSEPKMVEGPNGECVEVEGKESGEESSNLKRLLEVVAATKHLGTRAHPAVVAGAREMLARREQELASVQSTVAVALGSYSSDPMLARAVSASDFRLSDLMHGRTPTSVYLVSPPSDLTRLRPLMRLLLNQMVRRLTEENASGGGAQAKHKLLFLLDEFPTLGRMNVISEGIAYFRGFGIKLVLITQSVKQLAERYGEKNSIADNCDLRLTYHANEPSTGEYVSKELGTATYQKRSESVSGEAGVVFGKKQSSTSMQEHARPLMTADEVGRLPRDQAILFGGGAAPYRGKKVIYYDDERFKARAAIPPPPV